EKLIRLRVNLRRDRIIKKTLNAQRPTSNVQLKRSEKNIDFAANRTMRYPFDMSATEVIKELEELPSQEREKVLRWLQQQGFKDLSARADALMKDAPKLNEDEILRLPRVRPPGF